VEREILVNIGDPVPIVYYNLNVSLVGLGSVTSSPGGINCGSTCSGSFLAGDSVALTASASPGYTFKNWSGACSGTGACNLTMTADFSVTANFDQQLFFVGANSATGTTVAIPAHQAGDLIVIFAYNDASDDAPNMPSGWTEIGTGSGSAGNSSSLGYRVATSSGTTSGSWTSANATILSVSVFRGQNIVSPIGANAHNFNDNSSTVTYPGLSLSVTDGTSWVLGFAGHDATTSNLQIPPSGMVNKTNVVGGGGESATHDTNGGISSWNSQSVGVGVANGWRARTLEIKD
jgi:uncharacterized repeat protein (TIGR02543 family)